MQEIQLTGRIKPRRVSRGEFLRVIKTLTDSMGYSPAVQEIADALNVNPNAVYERLVRLDRDGVIRKKPRTARSIVLLKPELADA